MPSGLNASDCTSARCATPSVIGEAGDELPGGQVVDEDLVRPAAGGEAAVPGHRHAVDRMDARRQGLPDDLPRLLDRVLGPLVDPGLEQRELGGLEIPAPLLFPFGGISKSPRCAAAWKMRLSAPLPGTTPRPSRPLFASTSGVSMFRAALVVVLLWQAMQLDFRTG